MTQYRKHIKKESKTNFAFYEIFSICGSLLLLVFLLKNPNLASASVTATLNQCARFLIPSLFPLMVVSEIITECGAIEYLSRPLQKHASKLLCIDKNATPPIFLGLVGGYTASVNSTVSLYKKGEITKNDCERILSFSTLPSLAFLTGFVGSGIFESSTIGLVFWLVCIASIIIIALLEKVFKKAAKRKTGYSKKEKTVDNQFCKLDLSNKKSFPRIIVEALSHSAQAMLIICACVVFFSTLIEALRSPLEFMNISNESKLIILGSLELTNGISSCLELQDFTIKACLVSFLLGWSGLCIHFQIMSLCENTDISFKRYFVFKALQGIVCSLLALVIFSIQI